MGTLTIEKSMEGMFIDHPLELQSMRVKATRNAVLYFDTNANFFKVSDAPEYNFY